MAVNFTAHRDSPTTSIVCTDTSSFGTIWSWSWSIFSSISGTFGSTTQNPTFTGISASAGFNISLTLINTLGESTSLTQVFNTAGVSNGVISFTSSPDPAVFLSSYTLTDTSSGSPLSWLWNGSGGYTSNTFTYSSFNGNYGNLEAWNSASVHSHLGSTSIGYLSYSVPYINFTYNDTRPTGVPVSIYYSHGEVSLTTVYGNPTFTWDFGDGNTQSGTHSSYSDMDTSHSYSTPGTKTITLTMTWPTFGPVTQTHTTIITSTAVAAFSVSGAGASSGSPQVTGTPVTFIDQSTGSPGTWLWDFGDGNTSTSQNPTHSYSASGTYTVSLTVS